MRIYLREASSEESDLVFDILREAIGPYVELQGGWDQADELKRHAERWRRQRFRITVAEDSDVGYVSTAVYRETTGSYPAPCLYLHQLMIRQASQSRGIGSYCLRLLQDEARELGLPLRLRALRVNPRALAFYLAAGCLVIEESTTHTALQWSP